MTRPRKPKSEPRPTSRPKHRAVIGRPSGLRHKKPWRGAGWHDARAQEFLIKIFGTLPE